MTPRDRERLARANMGAREVDDQVNELNDLIQGTSNLHVERMFSRSEDALERERDAVEVTTDEEIGDPNLYYYFILKDASSTDAESLLDRLNQLDIVEIAYPQPISRPSQADIAPATPDFTGQQGYLGPAPTGIDAQYAWRLDGGKGHGIRLVDVESGWNLDHEDLPSVFYNGSGINLFDREHGTQVLGVLVAGENGYGMTGIVPGLEIGVSTVWRVSFTPVPAAIDDAAAQLRFGDILLIEQHAKGPSTGQQCPPENGNCGQWEFIAQEYWPADFDAIRRATGRGIIVVEAAGNGGMNLDSPIYERRFDRTFRDSGAILVGAGMSSSRSPESWTNFGSRVDLQGWGDSVATLGAGDFMRMNGDDVRQWYTVGFSGTSSASPIVAGAAASVQGALKARNRPLLNSVQMRDLLRTHGTAQGGPSSRQIGPLPNLRATFDASGVTVPPPSGWPSMGGILISRPVVGQNADGRMEVFVLGTDECLYHIWQAAPSNGWAGGYARRGDRRLRGEPVVTRNADGRVEVFARGADNAIWHVWQTAPNNGWSDWESLGGIKTSRPAVGVNRDGRLEVFARGTDNAVYHKNQITAGAGWWPPLGGWESLGGVITSEIAVGRNADGRLEFFARGLDNAIWHRWQESPGGSWSSWASRGGVATSAPTLGTNADGRLELFIRGTDGAIWHMWQTAPSNGWSEWRRLGGELVLGGECAVILNGQGQLEVFARASDGTMRRIHQVPAPAFWSSWENLGGALTSDAGLGVNADRRLEVFARGSDRSLVHRWQVSPGGAWNP